MENNENNENKQREPQNENRIEEGFWEDRTPPVTENRGTVSANRSKITLIIGAVVLALVFFFVGWFAQFYSVPKEQRRLLWILDRVQKNYYKEEPDGGWDAYYGALYDAAMPDIFCSYFSPEEFDSIQNESEGKNADTGFSAIMDGTRLRVFLVQGNSPADLAGLKSGMTIFRFGKTEAELVEGDRTALGNMVSKSGGTFYVECGFDETDKQVRKVTSSEYLASYCSYADSDASFGFRTVTNDKGEQAIALRETGGPMAGLDEKTAYLRYLGFDGNSDSEFLECLNKMKERGRTNLIIDLRCNGGGYLNIFQSISSHLLRNASGETPAVAHCVYRNGKKSTFYATGNDFETYFNQDSRITILADENSASASECLIGALVDYGTVGYGDIYLRKETGSAVAHSYGKGVMQSAYVASDGGALRLTSASICWPVSMKCIHGTGVTETDGAHGVVAPLLPEKQDAFLTSVFADLFAAS